MNVKEFRNWYRFENYAKDNGFDSLEFMCVFPAGPKKCRWLDAYMGLVQVDGLEGFMTTRQLDENFPDAMCFTLEEEKGEAA